MPSWIYYSSGDRQRGKIVHQGPEKIELNAAEDGAGEVDEGEEA